MSYGEHTRVPGFSQCIEALQLDAALRPWAFYGRKLIREAATRWYADAEGFPTLLGARVRPLPHQLYAVLQVLRDRSQRFLLADEVGLGKTIEAGLVLQALWHHRPSTSVLVLCPGSMVHQWWRELYLRFGARAFTLLESSGLSAAERNRRLASRWIIASTTALLDDEDLGGKLAAKDWEALVIDEGHHLDASHPLYAWVHERSRRARHVLVLSATPSQRHLKGLAALLALVAPEEYRPDDVSGLERRIAARKEIWKAIDYAGQLLAAAEEQEDLSPDDIADLVSQWGSELRHDQWIDRWLTEAGANVPAEALGRLRMVLAYARERWRLDHRIIRTRRSSLRIRNESFPERQLETELEYEPSGGEIEIANLLASLAPPRSPDRRAWYEILHRGAAGTPAVFLELVRARRDQVKRVLPEDDLGFAASWESEPGPAEEARLFAEASGVCPPLEDARGERAWLDRAAAAAKAWLDTDGEIPARWGCAIKWLGGRAEEDGTRKFLVFAQDHRVAKGFAAAVNTTLGLDARAFHHGLPNDELEKTALAFTTGSTRVLVCDELGGEGRNFQVAWAVVHLDVPVSPARIEQRIGRVDRLGRPSNAIVRSVVVVGPTRVERLLHRTHRDVFGVYSQSIGGLEFIVPRLLRDVRQAVLGNGDVEERLGAIREEVRLARAEADESFQAALDTARAEIEQAAELAELLAEEAESEGAIRAWLKSLGVDVRWDGPRSAAVRVPVGDVLEAPIPEVSAHDFRATFARSQALADESRQFLAPGHRLVDGSYGLLDGGHVGRAAAFRRHLGRSEQIHAVAVIVTDLPDDALALPAGLVARARGVVGRDVEVTHLKWERTQERWIREKDRKTIEALEKPFEGSAGDRALSPDEREQLLRVLTNAFSSSLEEALAEALVEVQARSTAVGTDAAERLEASWADELAYYDALIAAGEPSEVERAMREKTYRRALVDEVRGLRPVLDGIALIFGI